MRLLRHDEATREWYGRRYQFLMVDEYQDTNRTQYELMRLLASKHSNVCVVGDEDQSIYGWRGADIRNILDFEQDFPGARVIRLEQNYRSTQDDSGSGRRGGGEQHRRARANGCGPRPDAGDADRRVRSRRRRTGSAVHRRDDRQDCCAREPATHVAVLYRTNFQSRQIEEALRRYGRKYKVVGGFSFYQRAEVKDALAYVKLLVNRTRQRGAAANPQRAGAGRG